MFNLLSKVREINPLVLHYTNEVTINDCANITLALGASPLMSYSYEEIEEIIPIASCVVINIGTMNSSHTELFLKAGKIANKFNKPVVLDPVGVFATKSRTLLVERLINEVKFDVIKGNASEIKYIGGFDVNGKGVDSFEADENIDDEFIIYNANGGENAPKNQSKDNNIISENIPTRKNYIFKGWGNSENSSEILYKPGDRYDGDAPITLYAIWEEETKISNLQDFLSKTNTTLEKKDVLSISFLNKVSESESKKEVLLKTDGMVDTILNNLDYLNDFDIRLVPKLSSNSNVLFNSQYSNGYAGYMAFDKNYESYWCTNGTTNNSYIGYNMQIKAKVYFASICSRDYNGKVVTLQCSNDNKNWKDASDDITLENTTKTYYIKNTKEIDNGYQYWRILVKTSYRSDYVGISEAQFYGVKEENNTENKFEEREDTELLNSCSDELKKLLIETNIKLTTTYVITESFFEKICENKKLFFKINNVIDEIL